MFFVSALSWDLGTLPGYFGAIGTRKPSVAVTVWVSRLSRHGALQQLQRSKEPCSGSTEKKCLVWILGQR